jgi:GGDEF domain-containing protein
MTMHRNNLEKLDDWLPPEDKPSPSLPENKELREGLEKIASGGHVSSNDLKKIARQASAQLEARDKRIGDDRKKIDYLRQEAFIDPETKLLNKSAFHAALKNIVKQRLQAPDNAAKPEPVTVVVIDLNYLKPINNASYHGCGNAAINYLTDYISKNLRGEDKPHAGEHRGKPAEQNDLFTRLSAGDEFGIIMKNCTPEVAGERLQPILNKMAEESIGKDNPCIGVDNRGRKVPLQVSAAFGCAQLPDKYAKGMELSSDLDTNINEVIHKTLKAASEEEKKDKVRSKTDASSVKPGGFPYSDDRQGAEKTLGKFLNESARKFNRFETDKGHIYTLHDAKPDKSYVERYIRREQERQELKNLSPLRQL